MKKILNYINGELVEPKNGAFLENINPATGEVYSLIPDSDAADIDHIKRIFKYIDFNYRTGELSAMYFDFVMMPKQVIDQVRTSWKNVKNSAGRSVWD